MAIVEFKHHQHVSNLGTNGIKQRSAVLGDLGDDYWESMSNGGLLHDIGGCIDAPALLPSGSTISGAHQLVDATTYPGTVAR